MAKFDELLEQTYQTLGETYGGASMAPGASSDQDDEEPTPVDKLKAAGKRGNVDAAKDAEQLEDEGDELARKIK